MQFGIVLTQEIMVAQPFIPLLHDIFVNPIFCPTIFIDSTDCVNRSIDDQWQKALFCSICKNLSIDEDRYQKSTPQESFSLIYNFLNTTLHLCGILCRLAITNFTCLDDSTPHISVILQNSFGFEIVTSIVVTCPLVNISSTIILKPCSSASLPNLMRK